MFSDFISRLVQELQPSEPVAISATGTSFSLDIGNAIVHLSDTTPGVHMECNLGKLPDERPDLFMTKMLHGCFLGQMTKRCVLGLSEDGRDIILSLDLPIVRNYREFRDQLEDFINTASFWKEEQLRPSAP